MLLDEIALKTGKAMSTVDIGMRYFNFFYHVDKPYLYLGLHQLMYVYLQGR